MKIDMVGSAFVWGYVQSIQGIISIHLTICILYVYYMSTICLLGMCTQLLRSRSRPQIWNRGEIVRWGGRD